MKRLLLFCLSQFLLFHVAARTVRDGFAIVIDPRSHAEARAEVKAYADAIEQMNHLKVCVLEDRWGVPDSLRAQLFALYNQASHPLAGFVLVGDIPVPMIRDAQHLASAFKMSQELPWQDSSIPSDRFYDDFGLQFHFLHRDSAEGRFFYYSLSPVGEQVVRPNLFSGRIRPTDSGGTSRYDKLRRYLRKATQAKLHPERLNSLLVYTGSGSLSESKVAHIDEMRSMDEHFPRLAHTPRAYSYIDFSDRPFVKQKLMSELMRPDLGLALMHHHGDYDTQYLSSYPAPRSVQEAKEYMSRTLRRNLERAQSAGQSVDSVRHALCRRYGLDSTWLAGVPNAETERQDSLTTAQMNIALADFALYNFRPNCRVALYDACYNGSFHRDDAICNEYIFQSGHTVCGIGGTVNVLQDKWPDKLIGLFSEGVMAGYINLLNADIEMHVIGDPTFVFAPDEDAQPLRLNHLLANGTERDWLRLLSRGRTPDVRSLAIARLAHSRALTDERLLSLATDDASGLVRLMAYRALVGRNGPLTAQAIVRAADDNYELLQRFAVNDLIKYGGPDVLGKFAEILTDNNRSARVAFNAMQGVQFFAEGPLLAAVEARLDSLAPFVVRPDNYRADLLTEIKKYAGRWDDDIRRLCADSLSPRRALLQANFMRIYLPAYLVEPVARFAERTANERLQRDLLEALGWHRLAYSHEAIAAAARRMQADSSRPTAVRDEALRTLKRIETNK